MNEDYGWFSRRVDFNLLQDTEHYDEPGVKYHVCPVCGGDYLPKDFTDVYGQPMCIDCYSEYHEWEKNRDRVAKAAWMCA